MSTYNVSQLLKSLRIEKKLTQEEVAFGICSTTTLSRYENGVILPSKERLDALLERMGELPEKYISVVGSREYECIKLKRNIHKYMCKYDYEKALRKLRELKRISKEDNVLLMQYINLRMNIIHYHAEEKNLEELAEVFIQVIRMTISDFKIRNFKRYHYTLDEILAISYLARICYRMGKEVEALNIAYQLKDYMEKTYEEEVGKLDTYQQLLLCMSNWETQQGKFEEAIDLCDAVIENAVADRDMSIFPKILWSKGIGLIELDERELGTIYIKRAYILCEIMQLQGLAESIKGYLDTLQDV